MAASNKTTTNRTTGDNFDKDKALEAALQQIQKQYGKGAIMKLGESGGMNIETISTGSISLDIATGVFGIPKGRLWRFTGRNLPERPHWRSISWRNPRRREGAAAFIDAEHALDPEYAANLGVDVGRTSGAPAGYRRAGSGNLRDAGAQRSCGRRRRGFRGGAGA